MAAKATTTKRSGGQAVRIATLRANIAKLRLATPPGWKPPPKARKPR
jgi:hypothetical protein